MLPFSWPYTRTASLPLAASTVLRTWPLRATVANIPMLPRLSDTKDTPVMVWPSPSYWAAKPLALSMGACCRTLV